MGRLKITMPGPSQFCTTLAVRIDDINYREHLAHDKILTLCHEVRCQFLKSKHFTEMNLLGRSLIMVDCAIQYKNEGHLGDLLQFEISVSDISGSSFSLYYKITHKEKGHEVAKVKTTMAFFDYDTRKIQKTPEGLEKALS